jgi:hypothetical protein
MKDGALASVGSNVAASWDACQKLLRDMGAVSGHLAQMGWQVKEGPSSGALTMLPAAGGSIAAGGSDGGDGLVKAILLLRLTFSYITEAVQNQAARPAVSVVAASPRNSVAVAVAAPPLGGEKATISVDLLKELKSVVARLVHAEAALEGPCTCLSCLNVLSSPLLCAPCGHTVCAACLTSAGGCPECDGSPVHRAVANHAIEAVCSKLEYRRMALASIQGLLGQQEREAGGLWHSSPGPAHAPPSIVLPAIGKGAAASPLSRGSRGRVGAR